MKERLNIKFLIVLLLTVLFIFICNINIVKAAEESVMFKDKILKDKLIEAGYDTNGDKELSKTEMEAITNLNLSSSGITDITGLENAVNLTTLRLDDNNISDINLLENLTNLRTLGLSRNVLKDISVLENFTKLEDLWLYGNQIENIGVLANLTKLRHVELNSTYDIDKIVPKIPDEIILNISKNETIEQKVNAIEIPEAYEVTYSISSSADNIAGQINLKLILKQTHTELGHKYISIKYISNLTEKLEKILSNQITLNVKEAETEKADKALEDSVKNICRINGINLEELKKQGFELNMYVSPIYFGMENFYNAYIQISYHNLYSSALDKTIKIKYSNTNQHNINDEKYIKNIKLPEHKYFIYDIKEKNIFNTIERYYQSKISDKSLKFVASCGAGGAEPFENVIFHGNSFCLAILKNEMLYDIKNVHNAYIVCQIVIPENIKNTESEKIKYALPLIKEQVGSTRNISLKRGAKLEGTNIAIEDGYTIIENGVEIGNVILKKQEKIITNIKNCAIANITNQNYTGKAVKPSITIKNGSKVLKNGTDYTVNYKNNTNLGTATVTITGKGNYTGTVTKTFKIVVGQVKNVAVKSQTTSSITVKWSKPSGSITGYEVYMATSKNGKYKKVATITKSSTTTYKKTKLSTGKNYYFKVRAYKTIKKKKTYGAYSQVLQTATKTKTPSISKVTAGKKKATIKWKKVSGATGYEVYMSTSKSKGYKKIATNTKNSKVSYTKTKLKSKKKYYFKIRTYKTVAGKKIYSSYSSVKNVKVK